MIESQKANYLAPDDIVKKYKELEIQQQRDKVYNSKVICAILDFVKTLKDPTQELDKIVEDIKRRTGGYSIVGITRARPYKGKINL